MNTPTLSLAMIVRDVAPFIERCLGSVIDQIDELCIVDTGSKDDTIAVIEDLARMRNTYKPLLLKIEHYTPQTNPEGFLHDVPDTFANSKIADAPPAWSHTGQMLLANYGAARQKSWGLATCEYVMWIDSDDLVAGAQNIPTILQEMQEKKIDTTILTYDYDQDDEERTTCRLLRARITRRLGPAKWNHAIHEVLGPFGESKIDGRVMIHHIAKKLEKDVVRPALRNYKVLVKDVNDTIARGEEIHPRMFFYLGNESRGWNKPAALKYFSEYLKKSDWPEEMSLAHVYSGQLLEQDGEWRKAQAHYAAGATIFPQKPEAHFGLARIAHYLKDWHASIRHHEQGRIQLAAALDVLHYDPMDRRFFPAICAADAYLKIGQPKKALRISEEGLKIEPKNLQLIGSREKAIEILSRRQRTLTIHIFTGGSVERWNAESPQKNGIGGSETAAIHIARTLAKRGHLVKIFCDCAGIEGTYDTVQYIPFEEYGKAPHDEAADVFISSRRPQAITNQTVRARLRVLWVHDNHVGPAFTDTCEGLLAADLIMPVSNWHRDYFMKRYPFLDPMRVVATRNGIDERLYADPLPPKKNKLIYASSADRGLILALDYFKLVRAKIPDAELHVFYGFETVTKMVEQGYLKGNDAREVIEQIEDLKRKASSTPGVFLRGRVGQQQLAAEFRESKVWFYPTWFDESSCITAMEAQAAGCTPVTTALAALTETVHHGYLLKPPATSHEYRDAFVARVIWCLENEPIRTIQAEVGRENSLGYHSWHDVAEEWEDLFCQRLSEA